MNERKSIWKRGILNASVKSFEERILAKRETNGRKTLLDLHNTRSYESPLKEEPPRRDHPSKVTITKIS